MEANGEILEHCRKYLLTYEHRTARFYMLPKIHKGVTPPPGRPIISGNGCPTERISHFVDHFMRELAPLGASYLKDTTRFLQTLEDMGPVPGTLLVTMDITSLYANIPNGESIKAACHALLEFRANGCNPSNTSLLRLLRQVR